MEEWRDIAGYEGFYQASNLGRVRSLSRVVMRRNGVPQTIRERVLRPGIHEHGYPLVGLCRDGVTESRFVHLLVIETFRGKPKGREECRHLNGDPGDARLENLEYGHPTQNQADRVLHGTSNRGSRNGQSKLTEFEVESMRTLHQRGELSLAAIGKQFRVSKSTVWGIVSGRDWQHMKETI